MYAAAPLYMHLCLQRLSLTHSTSDRALQLIHKNTTILGVFMLGQVFPLAKIIVLRIFRLHCAIRVLSNCLHSRPVTLNVQVF